MRKPVKRNEDAGLSRVLVDFDGTLAKDVWPSPGLGPPIKDGLDLIRFYAKQGYEVSVYTARPASHESAIWAWLTEQKVQHLVYDVICDKPAAWLYIDDRSWNPWKEDCDCQRRP